MAGSFSNSFALVKASARVLKMDKQLMVFPLLSGIATVLVTTTFFAPVALLGGWEMLADDGGGYPGYVFGFLFYLAQYTVIFFFNSALVGAALIRLDGGNPTISDGLAIAGKRMGAILGYAVLAATVGVVLNFINERAGFLGRLVAGLVGMGWRLATYLTVPVLVTKDVGPIDAVKESATLLKQTWGEQVVGNFGLGWATAMAAISWGLVSAALIAGTATALPMAVRPAVVISALGFIFLALLSSALKGVYTAALYRYAVTGEEGLFDPEIMDNAFRPKR